MPSQHQKLAAVELSILLYGDAADLQYVPEAYPYRAEVIELPHEDDRTELAEGVG